MGDELGLCDTVGAELSDGAEDGVPLGTGEGSADGAALGSCPGARVAFGDGAIDGLEVGIDEGEWLGLEVGIDVGDWLGSKLGAELGDVVGSVFGLGVVGSLVGRGVVGWLVGLNTVGAGIGGNVSISHSHQTCSASHLIGPHPLGKPFSQTSSVLLHMATHDGASQSHCLLHLSTTTTGGWTWYGVRQCRRQSAVHSGSNVGWGVGIGLGSGVVGVGTMFGCEVGGAGGALPHPHRSRTLSQWSILHRFFQQYRSGRPLQNSAHDVKRSQGQFLVSHTLCRYTLRLRHSSGFLASSQGFLGLSQNRLHFLFLHVGSVPPPSSSSSSSPGWTPPLPPLPVLLVTTVVVVVVVVVVIVVDPPSCTTTTSSVSPPSAAL